MAKDLVCGMEVDERLAKQQNKTVEYKEKTYYFCSIDCKNEFNKAPEKYIK